MADDKEKSKIVDMDMAPELPPEPEKPAEPVTPETPEKPSYIDVSGFAPKKEGYTPDTEDKKFFDFVQDRYRAGTLGVAPGYTFYSDSEKYNPDLVAKYKERYPELYQEYSKAADVSAYTPTAGKKIKNEHELADFWDYAAGRQEKNDLRDLYMYGFKSDDERATPEILQRLKDENPWLWDEYQKYLSEQPPKGEDMGPAATIEKPVGDETDLRPKAELQTEEKKGGFGAILDGLAKMGVPLMEIINAGALGQAGITDPEKLAYGRRQAREAKERDQAIEEQRIKDERAFTEGLETKRQQHELNTLMKSQEFQSQLQDKGFSHDEQMAIANHARDMEKAGYDRETAITLATINAEATKAAGAGVNVNIGDPLGIKGGYGTDLDQLFESGQISEGTYQQAVKDREKEAKQETQEKGKAALDSILGKAIKDTPATGKPTTTAKPSPLDNILKTNITHSAATQPKPLTQAQKLAGLQAQGWQILPDGKTAQMIVNGKPVIKNISELLP